MALNATFAALQQYHYMYKSRFVILSVFALLAFGSCCKKRTYCQYDKLNIVFTGFNRSESRTVWLKRYEKGKVVGKALDSAQFIYSGIKPVVTGKPDTLWLSDYSTIGVLSGVYPGNDWVLVLTGANRTYTIDLIGDEGHNYEIVKCGNEDGCINKVSHYALSGAYSNSNTAYIKR